MLRTSDPWSVSRLTQGPSKPAYYIEDCWILLCNEFVTLKVPFIECSSDLGTTLVKPSSSFITFVFQFQNISIIIYQIFTQ